MGGSHSEAQDGHIRYLFRVVKVDRSTGCSFLEEKSSGREFMLKEYSTNDEKYFVKLQTALKHRQLNSHPQVLAVFDVYARSEDTLCSHAHKIFLIVEHPFRTLFEYVEERRRTQDHFTENEVWSVVYSCCLGLSHLYGKGYQHQALSSNRIYIESYGLIKISDPELMKQLNNMTAKHNSSSEQHIYLSPYQIEAMEYGGGQPQKYSAELSDVFTLGMIALESMHLNWMDSLYENGYVSSGKLQQMLAQLKYHYSPQLREVVARMVRLDTKERITLGEIEKIVEDSNFEEEAENASSERRVYNTQSATSVHQVAPYDNHLDGENTKKINGLATGGDQEQSPSSAARTVRQNRSAQYNEKNTSPNRTDITRNIEAVPSVLQSQATTVMKPLQSTKTGSNIAGRGLRLYSNQFPKPSASSGITSPTGGAMPASKPDLKIGQSSLPSLLLPSTMEPANYTPSSSYTPSSQSLNFGKDSKQSFLNNKVLERNLATASYETSSIIGDSSSMWAPEHRNFMKENIGGYNYQPNVQNVQYMLPPRPYGAPTSTMMYRNPSDPNDIYGRTNFNDYAYTGSFVQPSLPPLSPGYAIPTSYLNNSFMSPSLMVGQFTFNTPTSISQSSSSMNPANPQPQYTQPVTHTVTFGDDKDRQSPHYDELEAKMKQLNKFALEPVDIGKGQISAASLSTNLAPPPKTLPAPKPSTTDKPLSDNTNRKSAEGDKKTTAAPTKVLTEELPKYSSNKKALPSKKPVANSLKTASVHEEQESNQHDQAIQDLLKAIDNPTIPKYHQSGLTNDSAIYVKSQSKANIALDVVEEKVYDDVNESQKPASPVSELQYFAAQPALQSKESGKYPVRISRGESHQQSQSVAEQKAEKVGNKPTVSVTIAAVNGKSKTLKESSNSSLSYPDNKTFKTSKQSGKESASYQSANVDKPFAKSSNKGKLGEPTIPPSKPKSKLSSNMLQIPLSKYHRDGSISFGEDSDSKEGSQPPSSSRKQPRAEYDSESANADDSLEVPSKESVHLSLSNFSKGASKMAQYFHEEYEQGGWYEGYKLNGMRHGFGKLHYRDGGFYEGEWKYNKMDGFAKLYYQNGEIAYEGYWRDDQFHGRGKVFNDSPQYLTSPFNYKDFLELGNCWLYYDGMFDHDTRTGMGTLKLSNGEIFEGCFKDDYIDGPGKFYSIDGIVVDGVWRQSKLS